MPIVWETGKLYKCIKTAAQSSVVNRTVILGQPFKSSETQKKKMVLQKKQSLFCLHSAGTLITLHWKGYQRQLDL